MTKYYIFRHGQTFNSKNHVPYPEDNFPIEILPESIPVLEKLAVYLKNIPSDYNVSSEYVRCQQSVKVMTEISGLYFDNESRLNEFDKGSFEEFNKRIESFLNDLNQKNYKTVVICTHGAVVAGLKNILLGKNFDETKLRDFPDTGVLICIEGQKIEEINFNPT